MKRGYRRGYPVAILVGFEENRVVLWRIFSKVVKPEKTLWLDGTRNDPKILYNFYESIVNALRPTLKEGVRSIILASPARTEYARKFIDHINRHHTWLVQGSNSAVFSEITGSAGTPSEVAALTRTPMFLQQISETTSEETENLIETLEKYLNAPNQDVLVLYSLEEAEDLIVGSRKPGKPKPEYLILTDKYLSDSSQKNRIQRLIQIATNRNVKTRIVAAESPAGLRLAQLGGLVCLARLEQTTARANASARTKYH
jgi:stalled ribosome rescue protein Dom34